ncbi:MAG: hypothetical protein V1729_03750 [Candidatus Woesearchaeota archaeon]
MLQPTVTEKERKLFTGRDSSIKQARNLISNNKTVVLLAQKGLGKTAFLKQLATGTGTIYIDLKKLSLTPESFSVEFTGAICSGLATDSKPICTLDDLKQAKLGKRCKSIIATIDNELQKIKPDQTLILKSAFSFGEAFSAENGKKLTVAINNCDELLKLNNFSQIEDVLGTLFDTLADNKSFSMILASSSVYNMRRVLKRFNPDIIELGPLSEEETRQLLEKIAGKVDERVSKEVYALSAGIPAAINTIASRLKEEKKADTQANIALIRYILHSGLADRSSASYSYCSNLFTDSLNRARGESLLKAILKVVSQNEPLRLTEIARRIYRSGPVTKSLIERLIEVDLLEKQDNTFRFSNPVLKVWCRLMFNGVEFDSTPDEKSLDSVGGSS